MTASGSSARDTTPRKVATDERLVCHVVVDASDPWARRRRLVGLLTLVVAAVWAERAYRTYEAMGTLLIIRSADAYVGRLSETPARRRSGQAGRPARGRNTTAELFEFLVGPLTDQPASPEGPSARSRSASRAAGRQAAQAAASVLAWGEGIRLAWVSTMALVVLAMLVTGLASLLTASHRTAQMQLLLGWIIIIATLGTFLCISLLVTKAGFPPSTPWNYIRLSLLHSAYGWFLLFVHPSLSHGGYCR